MNRRVAIGVAVVALVALGAWWFRQNFEAVVERVWVGFRGEAARDQFLAAEQVLARMGVEVSLGRSYARLQDLPQDSVAVLPAGRQSLTSNDIENLFAWIQKGGHLIVQPERVGLDDPLLARLDLENRESRPLRPGASDKLRKSSREADSSSSDAKSDSGSSSDASCASAERLADIRFPGMAEPMIVRFPSRSGLRIGKDTPDFLWGDRGGIHIASLRTGEGRVTALSALPFTNRSIDAHDHAGLLYHLVRWDGRAGVVRFFDRGERLSIWQWSADRAPYFLIALGALIVLWLWRTAARFGPIAPDPPPERRRLLDHLVANGRFQWRNGGAVELVEAAREQAFAQIRRMSPGFDALDRSRQLARLQELMAFSKEEARAVLRATRQSPTELLQQVRLFQRIHAALARRPIEQHQEAIV